MDYPVFLGDLQEDYNEADTMLQKIDIYIESMYREYMINREESDLKVMTESGTDEDLAFLYEEAKKSFSQKASKTMKKIVDSVSAFVNKVIKTVKEKYATKKVESALKKLEEQMKIDKSISDKKIDIIAIENVVEWLNMEIDDCHKVASKIKDNLEESDSDFVSKINNEIRSIEDKYQSSKKDIMKATVSLKKAVSLLWSEINRLSKGKFNNGNFIKISENASPLKESLLLKLNSMIGKYCKEMWSYQLFFLTDTSKKITKTIKTTKTSKSNQEEKKNPENKDEKVKEESVMENFDIDKIENSEGLYIESFNDIFDSVYLEAYDQLGGDIDDAFPDIDYFTEGANLDARKYFKQFKRQYKTDMKKLKKEVKDKKYDAAKKTLKNLQKSLKQTIAFIKSCDSTTGSVIFGYFAKWIPTAKRDFLICLIPYVGVPIKKILNMVEDIQGVLNSIRESDKKGEKISADNFNLYKNKLITRMQIFEKSLNKMETLIKTAEKEEAKI